MRDFSLIKARVFKQAGKCTTLQNKHLQTLEITEEFVRGYTGMETQSEEKKQGMGWENEHESEFNLISGKHRGKWKC